MRWVLSVVPTTLPLVYYRHLFALCVLATLVSKQGKHTGKVADTRRRGSFNLRNVATPFVPSGILRVDRRPLEGSGGLRCIRISRGIISTRYESGGPVLIRRFNTQAYSNLQQNQRLG